MGYRTDLRKICTIPIYEVQRGLEGNTTKQLFSLFPPACVCGKAKRAGTKGSVLGAISISPGWDDPATRNEPGKRKHFHQGPVKEDFVVAFGHPKGKKQLWD